MPTVTSRKYEPGDVVFESKPYIRVIRCDLWDICCAWCLKRDVELKRCSGCKMIRYCGLPCQKEAWKDHKLECPFLPRYTAGPDRLFVQMVASLILKTKGKDWKSITNDVMGRKVSLDDLKFKNFQLMRKPWFKTYLKTTEILLKSYLGEENVPDEETLLKLIGKTDCNHFCFGDEKPEICALFIGSTKFEHSCVPNAYVHFNGMNLQIKAIKKIDKFEKVTFSYCRMFSDWNAATVYLNMKESFGERRCYCSDCSQPYGQSPLTKILDPLRAVHVLEETEGHLLMASLMAQFENPMVGLSQEKLKLILKKQEGVLGDTNLARIRLLALKCLLLNGNILEMREELMTLANLVKRVWGENYEELTDIYKKLFEINVKLHDRESMQHCLNELFRLKLIYVGKEDLLKDARESFKNFFPFLI